jgi:mRNA interferase RelE/StbE
MAYTVEIIPGALAELEALPKKFQRQIQRKIDGLAENPRPKGFEVLAGSSHLCRIRSGDFRILYQIEDEKVLVLVVRIRDRKNVYRRLPKRIILD